MLVSECFFLYSSDNDGVASTQNSCYVDLPPIGFGIIILTRDIALNDVDNGGLVTKEQHSHSSNRLVYHVHSVEGSIHEVNRFSQAFFVSRTDRSISACCHRVGTRFVVRVLVGFSDGPIFNGSHYKVACSIRYDFRDF